MDAAPKTWILTGSPENFAATFRVIGMKERRRRQALEMAPGDRIWPGKPGKADPYPWRFETAPEILLEEDDYIPAQAVKDDLEWPAA